MQSDLPWNISGIPTGVREAARAAARREGLSTGEWLARCILHSQRDDTGGMTADTGEMLDQLVTHAENEATTISGLRQAVATLQHQIAELSAAQTNTLQQEIADLRAVREKAISSAPDGATPDTTHMDEIGQGLSEQLNTVLRFQQDFAEQTNAKIAVLAGTLTQMQKTPADPEASKMPADLPFAPALEQMDGRISTLSDSLVSLSGSVDLLRRDFRDAMEELGAHLGDFDARLQQFEENISPLAPQVAEAAAPPPAPEPEPEPTPEPPAIPDQAVPVPSQTVTAPQDTPRQDETSFDHMLDTEKKASDDFFSAEEAQEASGQKDEFSPDAKLDVPWHSEDYDADDEADARSHHRVLIFLRIVLVLAILLAAAAAFMAYHHIGLNELKGYISGTQTDVVKTPPTVGRKAKNTVTDFDRLTKLAKNGDSQAMLLLGISYADGTGVPANPKKALHWLEQAGSAGEAIAQYRLGVLYEGGHGTSASPEKAAEQFALAAKAGNLQAMYLLASAYDTGTGLPRSAAEAAYWYGKAANLGLADAAFNLARLYEQGNGVSADPVQAYQWYAIAAAEGDTDAASHLEDLKARLAADDMTKAGSAARAFKPQTAPADANMVPDMARVLKKAM